MKRVKKTSFNIDEDEAELFLSLKNAFSGLAIIEDGDKSTVSSAGTKDGMDPDPHAASSSSSSSKNKQLDHQKYAQEIDPDELASRVRDALASWQPQQPSSAPGAAADGAPPANGISSGADAAATAETSGSSDDSSTSNTLPPSTSTSPPSLPSSSSAPTMAPPTTSPTPTLSSEQKFDDFETVVVCVAEAIEYILNVLGPSKKIVIALGKVTDEYVKGWGLVENMPEMRYRYCLLTDKLGAKWLDILLEFAQISVEHRTEWLNRFMRNWSYANGEEDHSSRRGRGYGGGGYGSDEDSSDVDSQRSTSFTYHNFEVAQESYDEEEQIDVYPPPPPPPPSGGDEDGAIQVEPQPRGSPIDSVGCDYDSHHGVKRGRSDEDMEENMSYMQRSEVMDEQEVHTRMQWGMVKNMQLVGSMRFELSKQCGMREECIKIAQQLDDREKIVESRLMSKSEGGDDSTALDEAMKSLLHL